jgi:hypothetical protein
LEPKIYVGREEFEREKEEIAATKQQISAIQGQLSSAQAQLVELTRESAHAEVRAMAAEVDLRSERARRAAWFRWEAVAREARYWRGVGEYRRRIEESDRAIEHLERSFAWWSGRIKDASVFIASKEKELRDLSSKRAQLEAKLKELLAEFNRKVIVGVWSYTLRLSARVVSGDAPGSKKPKKPPRTVRMGAKSPIFVELSFEAFHSSIEDEKELEDEYKEELKKLIKPHHEEIAHYMNMLDVELDDWDFGIEAKKGIEHSKDTAKDFYEINVYVPSGYSYLVADGYYEHKV